MPSQPYQAVYEILSNQGLENTARAYLGSQTGESVRQVVFSRYPALPTREKNYLVGLVNSFLNAGQEQQGALSGLPIPQIDVPINPGLGGSGIATARYRYSTYVGVADPSGRNRGSINVDVYSPVELNSAAIAQAAEAQLTLWSAQYPSLAKYTSEHPLPTGVTTIGVQRAY